VPDLAVLTDSCGRLEALDPADVRGVVGEDLFFHETIVALAGSPRLAGAGCAALRVPFAYHSALYGTVERKRIAEHDHRRIAAALAARDSEGAELAMKSHLLAARDLAVG
jgi:DNA-binding GntR family transcriptional regulator